MPKIVLKPQSAEFADDGRKATPGTRGCDMPGCCDEGSYKAPKSRELKDYYHFCLDHVQEYNRAWDYFSGMTQSDIEDHITRSFLWDRPTRRYDMFGTMTEKLRSAAYKARFFTDEEPPGTKHGEGFRFSSQQQATPEVQAMAMMGLEPPLSLEKIKARYKNLVKKYHPDLNPGDKKAEELIKSINMSYTILKLSYEKYEGLDN